MKTYLQVILDCFSAMDIEGLRLYLNKDHYYQEATQEVFLNKLETLFDEFKASGDTELSVYRGNCGELFCNRGLIRTGYRFVGNVSGDYMDFRFITDTDDGTTVTDILDIFTCGRLKTIDTIELRGDRKNIEIAVHEEANFSGSKDYLIHSSLAENAMENLIGIPDKIVEFSELESWLIKYKSTREFLRENFKNNYSSKWSEFLRTEFSIKTFVHIINRLNQTYFLDTNRLNLEKNEAETIQWVLRIEEIIMENHNNFYEKFLEKSGNYSLDFWNKLIVHGESVHNVGKMIVEKFNPYKAKLIEKYFALRPDEVDQIILRYPYIEDIDSFLYLIEHLDIREKALRDGERIPLFLRKNKF